jgi:hypothetical protein
MFSDFGSLSLILYPQNGPNPASGFTEKRMSNLYLKIKYLLYEKKFTIQGAKKFLKNSNRQKSEPCFPIRPSKKSKSELQQIRSMLT